MPKIFKLLKDPELAKAINHGLVGVMPTDTVYGVVCRADNQAAVDKLYKLKARQAKPGVIIAVNIDQLVALGIKRSYLKAVEQFWPGKVSVVIPFSEPSASYLRQGLPDIAVRLPADQALADLLLKTGPLLTTSANQPNQSIATNIQTAQDYFGNAVDFYVDGRDYKDHQPSTVIKIIDDAVEVIRPGAVIIENNGVVK